MTKIPGCRPRTYDTFFPGPLLGIDEVGMGCLAGPVCVAGVVLPPDDGVLTALEKAGLRDSKEMSEGARERCFEIIDKYAIWKRALMRHPREIEETNLYVAVNDLCSEIIRDVLLTLGGVTVIIDGPQRAAVPYTHQGIVRGDGKSLTIAAAATYAKVTRDHFMLELAAAYPGYDWENNKGYPSVSHKAGLELLGVTDAHRLNTKPIIKLIAELKVAPSLGGVSRSAPLPSASERPLAGVGPPRGTPRG